MSAKSFVIIDTAFGATGAGLQNGAIARFWLPGYSFDRLLSEMTAWAGGEYITPNPDLTARVQKYFEGRRVEFDDPVEPEGVSTFVKSALMELRKVRWGERVTYRELAERLGKPAAARAIGMAMSKNPVPLIIPCHRVIRADGALGGFSAPAGVELKKRMLEMENPASR